MASIIALKNIVKFGHILGIFPWTSCNECFSNLYKMFIMIITLSLIAVSINFCVCVVDMVHKDVMLYILYLIIYTMVNGFGIIIMYENFQDKRCDEIILVYLERIDRRTGIIFEKSQNDKIILVILLDVIYSCNELYSTKEKFGYVAFMEALHKILICFQFSYVAVIFSAINCWVERRYKKLNSILQSLEFPGTFMESHEEVVNKITVFKEVYKKLYELNHTVNGFFGKYILIMFSVAFFNFLTVINYVLLISKDIKPQYFRFAPASIIFLVSLNL